MDLTELTSHERDTFPVWIEYNSVTTRHPSLWVTMVEMVKKFS